ncbi:MAG: prolipoprotein diacylglyceryl transferase family protein [Polyangiaceae bacterium]
MLARPLHLLAIWEGQGSFGGFIGAVLGALAWKHVELVRLGGTLPRVRRRAAPRPVLPLVDWLVSVFPVAWILGRLGCAVAHDHPGARASASAIFAVGYGPVDAARVLHGPLGVELRWGSAPRYDLGLLECAFAALMSLALVAAWRRRWPTGFYAAVVPLAYAPVRFALDFLRVSEAEGGDARYAGLTPAQWSCIALAAVSSVALFRLTSRATSRLAAARSGRGEARRGMPLG